MKRIVLLVLILGMLTGAGRIIAAPATPSASSGQAPSATPTDPTTKQINDLKDRLATKVAQLRQVQRRAIFGTVKSTSVSTITVSTTTKDIKIELVDEVKVIQYLNPGPTGVKGQRTKLATSDIAKGDQVVVFGDYDATVDILKANVIIIQNSIPKRIAGTISAIDKTEFTITVNATDGQSYIIDIETTTKTFAWDKDNGIQKGKFSKVNVGDAVSVVGPSPAKKGNRFSADRILDLGNLTGTAPTPTTPPTGTQSPTSTPITTPTSTPSPKKTPTPTP